MTKDGEGCMHRGGRTRRYMHQLNNKISLHDEKGGDGYDLKERGECRVRWREV